MIGLTTDNIIAVLMVLPSVIMILTLIVMLFALRGRKKREIAAPVIPKIAEKHYKWEGLLKEKKPEGVFRDKKPRTMAALWVALVILVALLALNVFVFSGITPAKKVINATSNETNATSITPIAETNETNETAAQNATGFRFPKLFSINFSSGFFSTKSTDWSSATDIPASFFKAKLSATIDWTKRIDITALWKRQPKAEEAPSNITEEQAAPKSQLLGKAGRVVKNAALAVFDFAVTYLYYIIAGLVILAAILVFLTRREKKEKEISQKQAPRKRARRK